MANSELHVMKDDNSRLLVECQSLQRTLDTKLIEKSDLDVRKQQEDLRNREQSIIVHERETKLYNTNDQLVVSRKEQENLRISNAALGEKNEDIQTEVAAFKQHSAVLQN